MLKEIRSKLGSLFLTLTKANGYSFDVNPYQVFTAFESKKLNDKASLSYPKLFLVTDKGSSQDGTSSTKSRNTTYLMVLVLRADDKQTPSDLADLIDDAKESLELLIDRNRTLDGLVHNCCLSQFTTDSGFCFPEAVVVAHLEVEEIGVYIDN